MLTLLHSRWQCILVILFCTTVQVCLAAPCSQFCAAKWNKCGGYRKDESGERVRMDRRCCDPNFHCVQRRDGFAQCRPKKRGIPATWEGSVLECEASAPDQLPQVSKKDAKCGNQVAACTDPYPCCSTSGQCGCTGAHCGAGCQSFYGTCAKSISGTPTQDPADSTPADSSPADSSPTDDAPTDSAPTDSAPTDSAPADSAPTDSAPTDSTPTDNAPVADDTLCAHSWIEAAVSENNRLRSISGTTDLECDEAASQLAASWSEEMCQIGLSHDDFASRCAQLGYGFCAENVLYNFHDSADAGIKSIAQWKDSPPHNENMHRSTYNVVGYGFFKCDDGKVMWTGLYGAKSK